jgi:hypothetical protein
LLSFALICLHLHIKYIAAGGEGVGWGRNSATKLGRHRKIGGSEKSRLVFGGDHAYIFRSHHDDGPEQRATLLPDWRGLETLVCVFLFVMQATGCGRFLLAPPRLENYFSRWRRNVIVLWLFNYTGPAELNSPHRGTADLRKKASPFWRSAA